MMADTLNLHTDLPTSATHTRSASDLIDKKTARIAGVFYLLVGVFGGFAQGFVEPKMYVGGDAAASSETVLANAPLLRLGVAADLANEALFVVLSLALTRC